jgi:hypothetical protein
MKQRAGEICQRSGVYRVSHYQHRLAHDAVVREGELFPGCRLCQVNVIFEFVELCSDGRRIEHIGFDRDFIETVWGIASGRQDDRNTQR